VLIQRSPRPLAVFKGPILLRGKRGDGEERREREGKGKGRRKGRE